MSRVRALASLEAVGYRSHMLHGEERDWIEKNCYIDVFIELLHALELEPLACLGFCAAVDFEGDHCTFFKPPHEELWDLFGVDIQELNVWRPLLEHTEYHLDKGRFISTEADSFHLPDTGGTDYRRNHVKTTIILSDLDVEQRRLGYFHNAGYHELEGEDFDHLFRIGADPDPTFLPLYAELVRVDRVVRRPDDELAARARRLLAGHLDRRPGTNPLVRFGQRFTEELPELQERGLEYYHAWAFATVRQIGAAFELLSLHLDWLADHEPEPGLREAGAAFAALSQGAQTFVLKAARAVSRGKPMDGEAFREMAASWDRGMERLAGCLESSPEPVA